MIAVIDYGHGNIGSIINMLKKIGVPTKLATCAEDLHLADKVILPGVGSFDSGMKKLNELGFVDAIYLHAITNRKPLLGICLGMQILGRRSEEGNELGLNLIPFDNKKFKFHSDSKLKIPHMGWNITQNELKSDNLVNGLDQNQRYYFVHSYHAVCDNTQNLLMSCDYGYTFAAAVKQDNIYGVQFHPEKSHRFGMDLLQNFAVKV
jgi:glutamine amidotransferase